jgi:hypothetical protein
VQTPAVASAAAAAGRLQLADADFWQIKEADLIAIFRGNNARMPD